MTAKESLFKYWKEWFLKVHADIPYRTEADLYEIFEEGSNTIYIEAVREYAREKCEEQRKLCGLHLNKAPNGYSGVSYNFITSAPEPNFG